MAAAREGRRKSAPRRPLARIAAANSDASGELRPFGNFADHFMKPEVNYA
jgi:hypothetical protein